MSQHQRQQGTPMTPEQQLAAQKKVDELSTFLLKAGFNFAKRHYVMTFLWVLGLMLIQFGSGFANSEAELKEYDQIMSQVDEKRFNKAQQSVWKLENQYYDSKGWFSCDARCTKIYEKLKVAKTRLDRISQEDAAIVSEAKSKLGVFSQTGVQETRDLFWSTFNKGKGFAQRSSMWDAIFMSFRTMSRDESFFSVLIRWLFQLAINFTLGLFGAFVAFVWYLWDVVSSYQPNFILAMFFFLLATITASSVLITYLVALYGAVAGSSYVIVKTIGPNMRIGNGAGRQPRYIRRQGFGQRPHYG